MNQYDFFKPPEDCEICEVCGSHYDLCLCPPCPECGATGNPTCYMEHGMVLSEFQNETISNNYKDIADRGDEYYFCD